MAIVGVIVIIIYSGPPDTQNGFFVGILMVLGGLLLRIEAAVVGADSRNTAGGDHIDPSRPSPTSGSAGVVERSTG